jgi:hypothetical protein
MPVQGSLSIERVCRWAEVSRAGFYRCLQARLPVEEEMGVRSAIKHNRRRVPAALKPAGAIGDMARRR